ncbi:MAG: hypothetical protein KBG48_06830 [Kofleriaceae bacterium]|nr:hypothetical protein [Kofleriaceae bacterium]MBP9167083.1 hypothetical protein [Kofleriaceae bacterium]MBP9861934.1 hypothetical protein [Kofleriaceae bacterium]
MIRASVLLVVGVAVASCGDDRPSVPEDAAEVDAASPDALDAALIDAAIDTPIDAAIDAPIDAPPTVFPAFRNPVAQDDLALARAASARLGVGPTVSCDRCHALTRATFDRWLSETRTADACLTTLRPTSPDVTRAILECFRPGVGQPYEPGRLGIYTTAAGLAWFTTAFDDAWGAQAETARAAWLTDVEMPRSGGTLLTQADFDVVAEWFARGLPHLDQMLNDVPPPTGCTPDVQPAVAAHVAAMRTEGWRARNLDSGVLMHGCAGAVTARDCLASYPAAETAPRAAGWDSAFPAARLRLLYDYSYRSSFWTRSSADGRFVAHGGGAAGRSTVIDLTGPRQIPANASYDPGFFPDNSGFVIQGGSRPWCRQSLLTSAPAQITFTEPECSSVSVVGLYQHLGAVAGGDYWAVAGQFVSDNGFGEPSANFGATARLELTPMVWNGTSYVARPEVVMTTPYEGDTIISPSAKLLLSRTAFAGAQSGFTMRRLDATLSGASYTVSTPEIARYCVQGGKPAFSYDERWLVYHHWVRADEWSWMGYPSADDPAFQALITQGTANIFLLDLTTGATRRITAMNPGQAALFPHFRSDGWIYFIVKDDAGGERVVASDAALVLE